MEKESAIVLDNVLYHSRCIEKLPKTAWIVGNIQEWLLSKNRIHQGKIKVEIAGTRKCHEGTIYSVYKIDKLAREVVTLANHT